MGQVCPCHHTALLDTAISVEILHPITSIHTYYIQWTRIYLADNHELESNSIIFGGDSLCTVAGKHAVNFLKVYCFMVYSTCVRSTFLHY